MCNVVALGEDDYNSGDCKFYYMYNGVLPETETLLCSH